MSNSYKELFQSNDNEKIFTKFLSLITEKKEKDSLKFLYELITFYIEEINTSKNIKSLIALIKDKFNKNTNIKEFLDYYLVQILWIVGVNLTPPQPNSSNQNETEHYKAKSDIFKNLVNFLLTEKIIKKNELLQKLEDVTLNQIGLLDSENYKNIFTKKISPLYEQNKFNLLREESEGYSKLISLLFDLNQLQKTLSEKEREIINEKIIEIIGYFNLDSYRVLDIALEIFKYSPFNINYIKIFDILNKNFILSIIDFKHSQNKNDKKLMIIVAQLIHFNYISLKDFINHMTSSLTELKQNFLNKNQRIFDYIKNSLDEEIKIEISSFNDNKDSKHPKNANYFCNFNEIINKANNYSKGETKDIDNKNKNQINQFYLLFESFIAIKDKENILNIYDMIKDFYDPLESYGVVCELCDLIKWMINPLLKTNNIIIEEKKNQESLINQCFTFNDFIQQIPELLKILNIGLSKDQILFQKLLTIMNDNIREIKNNHVELFSDMFINIIFPSLSLVDPCPSLLNLLWKFLSNFDYIKRYNLYENWITKSYKIHPYLIIKSTIVWKEIQKWQKCLSLENARKHGRILQIISNSNPIIAFDSIISILILYENQITTIMQSFSFCSYLSYDVITYIICKLLHEKRINLNKEAIGIDNIFKNFCDFISLFYKKYYNSEINGVINYIIDKFNKVPANMDIYLLKELIEKMTGIHTQEGLNENQILSESGGYKIYLQCKNIGREIKSFKKPTSTLMKVIQSNDNLICLFLLLNLQQRKILYIQKMNFQLMAFIYDQIHFINLQFHKLLNYYGKNEIFNKILDKIPVESLIKKYHLSPQIIFTILRKKNKKIYELSKEEYIKDCNQYKNIYDTYINYKKEFLENEFDAIYLEKEDFINDFYKSIWTGITPELYYIFNSLELSDIYFPKNEYDKQIEDLNAKARQANSQASEKIKIEIEGLTNEKRNLIIHHQKILDFLKTKFEVLLSHNISTNLINPSTNDNNDANKNNQKNKEVLDSSIKEKNDEVPAPMVIEEKITENKVEKKQIINRKELTQSLIQYLFFPRIIMSKEDALFVQKLINLLIIYKGETVNTIDILNKIPKFLLKAIICVTESEAENIGLFLNSFLNDIQSYQDEKFWEKNCKNNNSFSRKLEEIEIVELKDFKTLFNGVISNLISSIEKMLENEKENSNIRNIIIMMDKIPIIPPTKEKADSLCKVLSEIQKKNKNFIILESYNNKLKTKFKLDEKSNNENLKKENNSEFRRDKSQVSKKSDGKLHDKEYRRRDKSRERTKDRENDRYRDREKDREKDRDKDRSRERSRDKSRDREKRSKYDKIKRNK